MSPAANTSAALERSCSSTTHTVVDVESSGDSELDPRRDPDADNDEVGSFDVTVAQHDLFDSGAAASSATPVLIRTLTP